MASTALVLRRYALALYELAHQAGIHEQVEAELLDLDTVLAASAPLRRQLENPRLGRDAKRAILGEVLGPNVTSLLRRAVLLMTDKGRAGLLPGFAGAYNAVAMAASGREVARVQTAVPLGEEAKARLRERLGRLTGKDITLEESVAEELLGGLRVVIGSQMIDGSLARRLQTLKDNMLRAPLGRAS